jgi:hypothetical protein
MEERGRQLALSEMPGGFFSMTKIPGPTLQIEKKGTANSRT